MTTFLGLLRDFVVAVVGLLVAFGVPVTGAQETGMVLVLVTGVALLAWVRDERRRRKV